MMKTSEKVKHYLGDNSITIFDIGARDGFNNRWASIGQNVYLVGFEPDESEFSQLRKSAKPNHLFINTALDKCDREQILYLCRHRGCSSLYKPNFDFVSDFSFGWGFEIEGEVRLQTKTMDQVCDSAAIWPDALKLDTQGSELDILKGGKSALENVLLIDIEVSFQELYTNAPLFAEVDIFLRNEGFRLLGLRRSYWRTNCGIGRSEGGHLVHGDALYYRDNYDRLDEVQRIKLMALLLCYRQYDLVARLSELFDLSSFARLIPGSPLWIRPFGKLIRGRSYRILRKAVDSLRHCAKDWHDPDYF